MLDILLHDSKKLKREENINLYTQTIAIQNKKLYDIRCTSKTINHEVYAIFQITIMSKEEKITNFNKNYNK